MPPQTFFLAVLALAAGTLFPIQAAVNSQLAGSVGGWIAATSISITSSWFCLLFVNLVGFHQFPSVSDIARTPFHLLWLGGALGAIFLSVNVLLAPRLGSAALLCLVIAGQLMAALIIDRFGLFSFAVREVSVGRVVGVALVLAGAILVRLT